MRNKTVVFIALLVLAFVFAAISLSPNDSLPPSGVSFALQHLLK